MFKSNLKDFSRVKKYAAGAAVAGEDGIELAIVIKGQLSVYENYRKKNAKLMETLGPGGVFGEPEMFLGRRTRRVAVADAETFTLKIRQSEALQFIREEPEATLELLKALCRKQAGPEDAPEAAEEGPTQAQTLCAEYPLFPAGHGGYRLTLCGTDRSLMMDKTHVCPYCKQEFKARAVRPSKLVMESTDDDMRHRYRGVEPLYYDVTTCPNCLYSALEEMFGEPDNKRADLAFLRDMKQPYLNFSGDGADTARLFAGYYLALRCAAECFAPKRLAEAKLLLKLSRVYQDCGDAAMEVETAQRALDAYTKFYLTEQSDPAQDQQLCLIIGELRLKENDMKGAREFFFKAKTIRAGSPLLKEQAENRLAFIRSLAANG